MIARILKYDEMNLNQNNYYSVNSKELPRSTFNARSLSLSQTLCLSLSVSVCLCLSLSVSVCLCLSVHVCMDSPVIYLYLICMYTHI